MTKEEQIDKERQALDRVIDQMALASFDLQRVIKKNVDEIIKYSLEYSYLGKSFQFSANANLEKEVKKILLNLEKDLFNAIYLRCENVENIAHNKEGIEESDNKLLLLFLSFKIADMTFSDRINLYTLNLKSEVEAFVAIGIFKGLTREQILSTYINNLQKPFSNSIFIEAIKEIGFKAERIASKGISFGVGKYVSSFNNLKRLEQDTVFKAYNHVNQSIWGLNSNYLGWYTLRGSTYQCGICDSYVGIFHPKTELFGGYHGRCSCLCIPIYKGDLI